MASDINANIGVNIDTSSALSQLKNLQRQIASFHSSVAKSSESAAIAQRDLQKNFLNSINAIQGFSAELRTVKTTAESFTNSLEKNKFSMREYFRYAAAASGKFNKSFASEFSTIEKTAIERVKTLQTQYIKMGRDASGAMQAIAVRPTVLDMKDLGTQTAIAAQKQVIFNQLVKQGSTNLLNFGKNTQWAGRQLMVGFTLPLATLGMTAGRVFMDMEKAAIKFKKVYGDLFTAPEETQQAMENIVELGKAYTTYGIAVSDSLSMAADAAAAGFAGADLQNQTNAALKLSVLGQLDLNMALETTIALQNAFQISSQNLASEIDFLNAVENQTVVALEDITEAVPRVAPIIESLGGNVRDLAFFLAAMKEGGVNAAQGANALKSGLASLINPSEKAAQFLGNMGINIKGIIEANQGDLSAIVFNFAKALDKLDPLRRSQAIEQLFGKFQFARISALFDNITRDGTQAQRVLELAGRSAEELANLSETELGVSAASSMNKFKSAVEQIKLALVPIGELFMQIATPVIEFGAKMLDAFSALPDGVKKAIGTVITVIGGLGPIALMTFGLINNGIANMIKFFATVRLGYLKITGQAQGVGDETQYMTREQLEAAAAAASLDQAHSNLTQRFTVEKVAVDQLRVAYERALEAGNRFALLNPGMMKPGSPKKFASGGFVGGSGSGDTVPAMLTPGEFVVKKDIAQGMLPFLEALNAGKIGKFAEGGSVGRTVSVNNKSYDTLGQRSAKAIQAFIDNLVSSEVSLDRISQMLDKVEANFGKLSAKTVMSEARAEGMYGRPAGSPKIQRMHLQEDLGILPSGERVMGSFVRGGLESQNQQLRKGQGVDKFSQDWMSVKDGLVATLRDGGLEITDEVKRLAQDIDTEIHDAAIAIAKATNKDIVDDKILAQAAKQVVNENLEADGTRNAIAQTLQQQSQQRVIAPPTKGSLMAAGQLQEGEGWTDWVKRNVAAGLAVLKKGTGEIQIEIEGKLRTIARVQGSETRQLLSEMSELEQRQALVSGKINGESIRLTTGERRAADPRAYVKSSDTDSRVEGQKSAKAFNDGAKAELKKSEDAYMEKRKRNSPHPQAPKDGADDAKAYDAAFEEQVEKVARKPRRSGTTGPTSVGTGSLISIKDEKSGNVFSQEKYDQQQQARSEALTRVTNRQMAAIQNFSAKIAGASFALSSVAGVASMFGGKVGEAAGAMMQITSLMFALGTAITLLTRAAQAEALMRASNLALSAMPGGARGLGKLFQGVKGAGGVAAGANVLKSNVSTYAANFGKELAKISPTLSRIGGLLLRAAGPIGLIVSLLLLAVNGYKKANQSINGLGDTANLAADKLKTLGGIFNVAVKDPGFGSAFTGASKTGTADERTATQQVLETENFEKDFETQINAIKDAGKKDAERTLQALAVQLQASGFSSEAVQAIIDAIVIKAERTDLNLKFASIDFTSAEGLKSVEKLATDSANRLKESFKKQDFGDALLGIFGGGQLKTQIQTTAGELTSVFTGLKLGFEDGKISAEDFNAQMANLDAAINSLDPSVIDDVVSAIADDMGIKKQIDGINNYKDELLLLKAAAAGVKITPNVVKLLERANKAGADKKTLGDAIKLRQQLNGLIKQTAINAEESRIAQEEEAIAAQAIQEAIDSMEEATKGFENQITAHKTLVQLGYDEATAYEIASNSMYAAAIAAAVASDAIGKTTGELERVLSYMNTMIKLGDQAKALTPSGGGGGGSREKSAMQQALEQLGKQRIEIKNNIKAYAGLRKAGLSVAEAARAAADPLLAAALASTKVGTKQWKALVNQIKLARLEALKTSEGLRSAFDDLYSQANEYFDILERQVDRKYQDSIRGQERAIENLTDAIDNVNEEIEGYQDRIEAIQRSITIEFDRPIEALQEESSDLANDLALMDRAADEITKRYDEQSKALAKVAKINQQIANQQKSQLSLADALASGDIAAAASAMQQISADNAAAAAATQEEMLQAARDQEIANLRSASGMSREEIEERQFQISQQIYQLEEQREVKLAQIRVIEDQIYNIQKNKLDPLQRQLDAAEDALEATERARQLEIDAIDAQRQKWEDAQLALDLARIEAGEFNNVIEMTKKLTGDVVNDWKNFAKLVKDLTRATVKKDLGKAPKPAKPVKEQKTGGPGGGTPARTIPDIKPKDIPKDDKQGLEIPEPPKDPFAWIKEGAGNMGNMWSQIFGTIGTWLEEQLGKFQNWVSDIPGKLSKAGDDIWSGIQSIPTWLATQWEGFKTWLGSLPYKIGYAAGTVWGNMQNIGDWLSEQWSNFKTWVTVTLPNGIKQWGRDTWTKMQTVGEWLQTQWNNFKTWVTVTLPNGIKQWGKDTWTRMQTIGEWLATQWNNFRTWLTVTLPNGIKAWARNIWTVGLPALGTWLSDRARELENWIKSLPSKIGNWAKNLWDGFWAGFRAGEADTRTAGKATGGMIYRANGGSVPGSGNTDKVRAMLTPGEYVINKRATSKFRPVLQAINSGTFGGGLMSNRYTKNMSGYVPKEFNSPVYTMPERSFSGGGQMAGVFGGGNSQDSFTQVDNSVYNYNLSVNVEGSNSSAEQIANVVMNRLRNVRSQQVRGQVVR